MQSKELLQNPQVIQKIQSDLQRIAKEQGLNSYEIPRGKNCKTVNKFFSSCLS